MKIGAIKPGAGAALAPMAGVTDMPFRRICGELGAAWSVSEMLSAKGYLSAPREPRAVTELLELDANENAVGLQLFGHEPQVMAEAAKRLQNRGFRFIDINMGCPAHKIVSGGDGSALMKRPELAGRIIEAVVRTTDLPVTVKLRSGWDERHQNAVALAKIAEQSGAAAVALHARTRDQFYAGKADWSVIGEVASRLDIPVIGNGDVASGEDALRMIRETGCAGVMVGRAAQGNPWIFAEIRAALSGESWEKPRFAERVRMAMRHLDEEILLRGERSAVLMMRGHIARYLSGEHGCAKLRARINALTSAEEVRAALMEFIEEGHTDR